MLTHSKDGETNNLQWIYFPALQSLNQIKGDKEKESFMGSDFTYADVAGRQLEQDEHVLVKQDKKYYYIKSIPKNKKDNYSKINLLVKKNIFTPVSIVFYDRKKNKLKTLQNKKIDKIKTSYIVVDSVMTNHQTGGNTQLKVSNIKLNISISDNDVGIKGLKK